MAPRLIAISGDLKGTTFGLTLDEVSIGREPSNSIRLNDASISRRHCLINLRQIAGGKTKEDTSGRFVITDLQSFNGTFVNGLPIKQKELAHGDQIGLGDLVLLFLADDAEAMPRPAAASAECDLITRSTIRLRREDAIYLTPERMAAELPPSAQVARDLSALLKISRAISAIRNQADLQRELIQLVVETIPAERAVISLTGSGVGATPSTHGWSRAAGFDDSISGSRTIIKQVLRDRTPLLSNDLTYDLKLNEIASLRQARVCSVLCVPLTVIDQTLGVLYLDTGDRSACFDESHLQLLTAVASIAASALENVRHLESVEHENQRLNEELRGEHQMIGQSPAMRAVYQFIAKAAPSDATVLIRGDSGTGKELAARAIHANSRRADKPFIAINGATLSETLLESELFGHEKGAFTGAIAQKRGKLEVADGGTVFLDEVGELAPTIQAKLLRVLQQREFERLGGTRSIKIDIRLVAATNKDLETAVTEGAFREDLYYRLDVVSLTMPALKDREDDIQLLASYFASVFSKKCKRRINGISPEARALLAAYSWPGNVRELENAIERAVVLGSTEMIIPEDFPETILESGRLADPPAVNYHDKVKAAKKQIVTSALEASGGNYTQAAKELGLHATNLHRLIRNLGLKENAS